MGGLLDPAVIEDPYPFYRDLLANAPVYQVPGTEVYLVSSWQLVHEVLKNQRDYSANLTGILITGADGTPEVFDLTQFGGTVDAIANADEPFHAVHRKLVLPQLNARRVAAMEAEVNTWVADRVDTLLAAGAGDVVGELANSIPVMAMARLVGLPVEDVEQLLGWAFSGGDILAGTVDLERMIELGLATREMGVYLKAHFQAGRRRVGQAPPVNIIDELALGVEQGQITEDEAVAIIVVLVGAAGESTSSLVGSAIRLLAEDAELQQTLRADSQLIEPFIEEVVRLEAPFKGHYRVVKNETELGGVRLAPESRVLLMWAAANRDPAVFTNPDSLDIGRQDGGEHLGFGHGIHFCIGARLARMEARVILQQLLGASRAFTLQAGYAPRHVPSIFVRRLAELRVQIIA